LKNNNIVGSIEKKLKDLGLSLPEPPKIPSNVETHFAWVRIRADKAYISGHGPQNPDGSIPRLSGRVGQEISVEQGI
jgi:hypothetical protein